MTPYIVVQEDAAWGPKVVRHVTEPSDAARWIKDRHEDDDNDDSHRRVFKVYMLTEIDVE